MLHGSRLHRFSPSSYTSTVFESTPPATMTHPPTAAHAKLRRGSSIWDNTFQRAPSASRVSASHDEMVVPLASTPPKTAKRPSLNTHPPPKARMALVPGKALHCQLASLGAPCGGLGAAPAPKPLYDPHRPPPLRSYHRLRCRCHCGWYPRTRRARLASAQPLNHRRDALAGKE
jgi:hypothetical protein